MKHGRPPSLALLLLALALAACQSSQEESARLEREANAHPATLAKKGLSITRPSHNIQVLATALVSDPEASAAVVTLLDTSPHPLHDVPILVTVRSASGHVLYQNNAAGLAPSLVSVPLLEPGQAFTWIDDQVQLGGGGAGNTSGGAEAAKGTKVEALVGQSPPLAHAPSTLPRMEISGLHTIEDPTQGEGTAGSVRNPSTITQTNLVIYGVARRGGRIVAAGRAELSSVPAGGEVPFQMYFVGEPKGASPEMSSPASTLE